MGNDLKVCIGTDSQVKGKETEVRHRNCFHPERERRVYVYP